MPAGEPADIDRMKAVDVLARRDGRDHRLSASICLRQRQLHQDAVHGGIGVEPGDQREQLGLRRALGEPVIERAHARLHGRAFLAADIDLARGMTAHQDDRQSGHETVRLRQPFHLLRDLGP